jgi:hypothetical protein
VTVKEKNKKYSSRKENKHENNLQALSRAFPCAYNGAWNAPRGAYGIGGNRP